MVTLKCGNSVASINEIGAEITRSNIKALTIFGPVTRSFGVAVLPTFSR